MATLEQAAADVESYIAADIPSFLSGPPGVGKSDVIRAIAARQGRKVFDFRAILRDPVDLRGLPVPDMAAGLTRWLPAADLPRESDGPSLLFLDELTQAGPAMQAACFGLVLDRRIGEFVLPADCPIVAAGNRRSDRAGSQGLLTALANRFAHVSVDVDTTGAEFAAWGGRNGIHPAVTAFIRFRAPKGLLHAMPASPDVLAFPTPRSWAAVSRVMNAPDSQLPRLVAGLVGEGAAAEFIGFLRVWRGLPSIPAILSDPHGSKVPGAGESALCYAVAGALARAATAANFSAVVAYADRMPAEFSIVTVTDATRRDPALKDTAAYVEWCIRHQDVTL